MNKNILVSGSMAYDYIMDFPDSFKNHILPDQIHILNVCFVVEQMRKNYGGCAGNIAYTMKLLGGSPLIFATLGSDGVEYKKFLESHGIETKYLPLSTTTLTSSAHITTDKDHNQVIAYYSGAGAEATKLHVQDVSEEIALTLITPTQKEAMLQHAQECVQKNIPFVFDPSHQLTAFGDDELRDMIGKAKFYIANDYEMKLTEQKTGWSTEEILNHVEYIIVTLGEKGSFIRSKNELFEITPCPAVAVQDPTGAGDSYRAGFFTAYAQGMDLETCGRVGSVAATYTVEQYGTQNHSFTSAEFAERYEKAYGKKLELNTK